MSLNIFAEENFNNPNFNVKEHLKPFGLNVSDEMIIAFQFIQLQRLPKKDRLDFLEIVKESKT